MIYTRIVQVSCVILKLSRIKIKYIEILEIFKNRKITGDFSCVFYLIGQLTETKRASDKDARETYWWLTWCHATVSDTLDIYACLRRIQLHKHTVILFLIEQSESIARNVDAFYRNSFLDVFIQSSNRYFFFHFLSFSLVITQPLQLQRLVIMA